MRLNEAAIQALGFPFGSGTHLADPDPGALGQQLTACGLARDKGSALFVPGLSFSVPDFRDLTYRECQRNSWHLDDHPDVQVEVNEDGTPHISYEHQVLMLGYGIRLSQIVHKLARALPDQPPICCITGTNSSNGTFRFHQIRPDEQWINDDLDRYTEDMILVVEDRPPV